MHHNHVLTFCYFRQNCPETILFASTLFLSSLAREYCKLLR